MNKPNCKKLTKQLKKIAQTCKELTKSTEKITLT